MRGCSPTRSCGRGWVKADVAAVLAGMTIERMTDAMTEVYERARRDSGVRQTALSGREAAAANPGTRA